MNKKMINNFAIMGIVPAIAFANPLAEYYDPLFSSEPFYGHGMPHPLENPGMEFGEQLPPYLHGIDLTEDQQKSIKALIQKIKMPSKVRKKQGLNTVCIPKSIFFPKTTRKKKIERMIKNFSAQQEKIQINMAEQNHAIFELLTPEQQQQAQSNLITFSERLKKMQ